MIISSSVISPRLCISMMDRRSRRNFGALDPGGGDRVAHRGTPGPDLVRREPGLDDIRHGILLLMATAQHSTEVAIDTRRARLAWASRAWVPCPIAAVEPLEPEPRARRESACATHPVAGLRQRHGFVTFASAGCRYISVCCADAIFL